MKKKSKKLKSKHGKSNDPNNSVRNVLYNHPIKNYDPLICGEPLFLIKKPKIIRELELEYGIDTGVYIRKCRG